MAAVGHHSSSSSSTAPPPPPPPPPLPTKVPPPSPTSKPPLLRRNNRAAMVTKSVSIHLSLQEQQQEDQEIHRTAAARVPAAGEASRSGSKVQLLVRRRRITGNQVRSMIIYCFDNTKYLITILTQINLTYMSYINFFMVSFLFFFTHYKIQF